MKKLLILSGKGGTGKTTTAAAFIHFSRARAIADCDVDAPNLHIVTSMHTTPEQTEFIGSKKAQIDAAKCVNCKACMEHCRFHAIREVGEVCQIQEYFCEGCGVCAYVCPNEAISMAADIAGKLELYREDTVFSTAELKMGRGNSGKLVAAVKLAMLKAAPKTDLAIIDGSPGIGCPVISSINGVDLVLVVTEPTQSGLSDLKRLLKTTSTFQTKIVVCVNKWDTSPKQADEVERYCREQSLLFAGKIPYDPTASRAINEGRSVAEYDCPARDALYEIYQKVRKEI